MEQAKDTRLGFIGFGELAQGLAKGLKGEGLAHIKAFDKAMTADSPASRAMRQAAQERGVEVAGSLQELIEGSDLIFSTVTPAAAFAVAQAAAGLLQRGQLYADLNSCTPSLKRRSQAEITASGADYVDVGVVGGISIQGHKIPCLLCGEAAPKLKEIMSPYGMNMELVQAPVGTAALIKMLRSVVLKGIEALMLEMFMAAQEYGLEDTMMQSIASTFNRGDFEKYSDMLMSTHGLHAARRCDETEMILETVKEVGVRPYVTEGIYNFFVNSAKLNMPAYFQGKKPGDYKQVAKAIRELSGQK
ncbi:MAG: NAD(P)-binding domain-containing protein [Thermodesulfobacteriota bacterium]